MNNDLINGYFEAIAGLMQIINIVRIIRDRQVKGISILPTIFFIIWGIFNVTMYYPGLLQSYSWAGGVVILTTNLIWITLVFYYKQKAK